VTVLLIFGALLVARWLAQIWLEMLNQKHVRAHSHAVPDAFKNIVTPETYSRSVDYTLAKSKFHCIELTWSVIVLALVLFSGVLPWFYNAFQNSFGHSIWVGAAFVIATTILLTIPDLPFDWYSQFTLEQRFGFNTSNAKTFWLDRVKGLLLGVGIGFPLLWLIFKLVDWLGNWWWLWAWGCMMVFQLVMLVLAPIVIMPLFNKFSPLPEGALRDRLIGLGERVGFRAKDIQVMDGSKRSRHSNAFFTGFGHFRKIVLFDTLVDQLQPTELEAVLAHEIGHYKKRHIPKTMIWSAIATLIGFYVISVLAKQDWFYHAFGFTTGSVVPAFLLFGLVAGTVTFWISPVSHMFSRKYEYEADAYAAGVMAEARSLIGALRKLNEKNLSNLTPHPYYSGFYYSHPTLLEREQALESIALAG
jgi:STE24 endopeptidase